jgi:hypothetical protein
MRNAKLDSKHSLGATSLAGRQPLPQRKSEGSFLADQAADAKTAMIRTLHDMKETLGKVADVRLCAQQHPWLVIGSGVAAGFVTGAVVTPAPRKKIKSTRAKSDAESQTSCQGQETAKTEKSFLLSTAATFLASILRTVIQASIAAAVVDKNPPPAETLSPHDASGAGAPEGGGKDMMRIHQERAPG